MRLPPPHSMAPAGVAVAMLIVACASTPSAAQQPARSTAAADTAPIAVAEGLAGPESARYDPEQDVWFISNFNGDPSVADNNGFISRVRPDGTVDRLRFIAGGVNGVTLHSPRGLTIAGDTLWAADLDAVRAFDRHTGAPLGSVSFAERDVGFLNDVAVDSSGTVYVTDTGRNLVYRLRGGHPEVVLSGSALGNPNGIAWDQPNGRLIILPFGGANAIRAWRTGTSTIEDIGTADGARYDGVEILPGGRLLVSSQADSSLYLFENGRGRAVIHVRGEPADIGVDTRRNRVAVPMVARNRVEIWAIP